MGVKFFINLMKYACKLIGDVQEEKERGGGA